MTRTRAAFLLLTFFAAFLWPASRAPSALVEGQPERDEIGSRITQLGSPKFGEREAATAALDALGTKALAALRKAADSHSDAEVRRRARALAELIEKRLIDVQSFRSHDGGVYHVAFTADGRQLLSSGYDGKHRDVGMLRVWDVPSRTELRHFIGKGFVYAFAVAPDGKRVAVGAQHGDLSLRNMETGETVRSFPAPDLHVMALAFSPDGRWLLSGSNDGERNKLQLWDVEAAREVHLLREDQTPTTASPSCQMAAPSRVARTP
jgi:WD40 repeat protein